MSPAPAPSYGSPSEAAQAPPEEFLYVACLHAGTGVDAPDFIAVVDAEAGRIVHETRMPNVGDELHHFGWNACAGVPRPRPVAPDRARIRLRAHPRHRTRGGPAAAVDRQGHRAGEEIVAGDRADRAAHGPLPADGRVMISMLGDEDGDGAGRLPAARRASSRSPAAGRRRAGAALQLRLLVPAAAQRDGQQRVGDAERLRGPASSSTTSKAGSTASHLHFWDCAERRHEQSIDLGETGHVAARGALPPRPR